MLQGMADALPTHPQGDDSSDLASSYEVIALLVHAYLAALNFRLCGFDQDSPMRKSWMPLAITLPRRSLTHAHSRVSISCASSPTNMEFGVRLPQLRI